MFNSVLNSFRPTDLEQQQQQQEQSPNDTPWLLSTVGKAVGTVAGVVSIASSFFLILDILDVKCILIGALLLLEGVFVVLTEAPCCCVFFEFAYMPSTILDKRPPWVKATLYLFFAAIPFLTCPGVSTFFPGGLLMATSALYLLMALGKKANREEMREKSTTANGLQSPPAAGPITTAPSAVLVQNEELPAPSLPKSGSQPFNNQVIY